MFAPARHTESETLAGYLEQQLAGIRASAYGLTEEQARETPCRSTLSIGGLIKHTTHVLGGRARNRVDPTAAPDEAGFAQFMASFALGEGETLAGALEDFDAARAAYLETSAAPTPGPS